MARWPIPVERVVSVVAKPINLLAALGFGVMLAAGGYASWLNQTMYEQQTRASTFRELNLIRAKLEGKLNGNFQLVRGLVAALETEPGMDELRFAQLAGIHRRQRGLERQYRPQPRHRAR